ncbi:CCT-gamma [Intoshia linei]|uniref:T-complex protein 1 subunit gamma n=1 Tax=Intoshia linei TaxID=1819745 RepID=A0A177B442_9BILA|nr:CCT-gamma [Intoshia linei]
MMQQNSQVPYFVLNQKTQRDSGFQVQIKNIQMAVRIADVIRTCLGPRAMLKMLMDPMGGVVLTNDGNCVLREIMVDHPTAKCMIEIARTQDEEVGDGTTSVIVLSAEILSICEKFVNQKIHPTHIISALRTVTKYTLECLDSISVKIDTNNIQSDVVKNIVKSSLYTKFSEDWVDFAATMAIKAVNYVKIIENNKVQIDVKRYAKVEKIPGGTFTDSQVLDGVMVNKDILHPKMRRRIINPRILLLDCSLEYKKGESKTEVEIKDEKYFTQLLHEEEFYIKKLCDKLIDAKPDLVVTEKGVSDLAQHFLTRANISVLRRVRKSDNLRIARATGATILNQFADIKESHIGKKCGLFEVRKIGDDYFSFIVDCKDPNACTLLLRGVSKDLINEYERNLHDAMCVGRNIMMNDKILYGGGCCEMKISALLREKAKEHVGMLKKGFNAVASALEIIPSTLILNCGGNIISRMTELRSEHVSNSKSNMGINGLTGNITNMEQLNVYDTFLVKQQTIKSAVDTAILILRIDDIITGTKKREDVK